jgi:hypothetical protein
VSQGGVDDWDKAASLNVGATLRRSASSLGARMSIDLYVFIQDHVSLSTLEWQQALDAKALPVTLTKGLELAGFTGFLPVFLNGNPTGFYFYGEDAKDLAASIPEVKSAHLNKAIAFNLNFGGNFLECASAYYSAAALVAKFNGRAFDPQDGRFLTFAELRNAADGCLKLAPAK